MRITHPERVGLPETKNYKNRLIHLCSKFRVPYKTQPRSTVNIIFSKPFFLPTRNKTCISLSKDAHIESPYTTWSLKERWGNYEAGSLHQMTVCLSLGDGVEGWIKWVVRGWDYVGGRSGFFFLVESLLSSSTFVGMDNKGWGEKSLY